MDKNEYTTPELTVFGDVKEITQRVGSGVSDAVQTGSFEL